MLGPWLHEADDGDIPGHRDRGRHSTHHRQRRNHQAAGVGLEHGRINYKDTKPYMSRFLSVDLLTDFAALCLSDFIDWRYIHSWFVFSNQLGNCCPHGRRN
jgi:hypothetical protein